MEERIKGIKKQRKKERTETGMKERGQGRKKGWKSE